MNKLLLLLLIVSVGIQAQSIISWTENNGTLGLGYPVPIPVDTPEAFDGFRTYAGLFAKHQSLAVHNDYITAYVVGQTRNQRDIWAYKLSDANDLTPYGVKEGVMLINGTIHAREWQSPELLTEIMELLDENSNDNGLHQFLLESITIMALPVNNVDGFLQTQRYPEQNWYNNRQGPRDGRMRRKNMLDVDEMLTTSDDYLLGVDLNRNNNPYWASSTRSSYDSESIVYHGLSVHSEPETLARLSMVDLVDSAELRAYTDVHSFTRVLFSTTTNNSKRNTLQSRLLSTFSKHQAAFPQRNNYMEIPNLVNKGIGATDEYFAMTYQIPSWTLEIEPANGGVDYGGFGNNNHDGFILPESEIARVREQLAQSFMVTWYQQAGVPSISRLQIVEQDSEVLVYDAQWDINVSGFRELFEHVVDNLVADRVYDLIVSFDKPMRVRDEDGDIVALQGQEDFVLQPEVEILNVSDVSLNNSKWLNNKSENIYSYAHYKDDTFSVEFVLPFVDANTINFAISSQDLVGQLLDANPESVARWKNGGWQGYDSQSEPNSISGGVDSSYQVATGTSSLAQYIPAVQPSGMYFDPERNGEGFAYNLLTDNRVWIQWFTYDDQGNQKWYTGIGSFLANRIIIPELNETSGGVFGSEFDMANIERKNFGSLEIVFNGGEEMPIVGYQYVSRSAAALYTDLNGKKLRTNFEQLSIVKGAINIAEHVDFIAPEISPVGLVSGSWYDPDRSGEGFVLEMLENGSAVVFWFTYDTQGNHMWLLASQGIVSQHDTQVLVDFSDVRIYTGGVFGQEFDASTVESQAWGELRFSFDCNGDNSVNYTSSIAEFGSGSRSLTKLTNPLTVSYVCEQ